MKPSVQKLPVTSNMYYSNTISFNKRPSPMPAPVQLAYNAENKLHNFKVTSPSRRQISETFKATDRNYSHPARTSPIMMTSGVHPDD